MSAACRWLASAAVIGGPGGGDNHGGSGTVCRAPSAARGHGLGYCVFCKPGIETMLADRRAWDVRYGRSA